MTLHKINIWVVITGVLISHLISAQDIQEVLKNDICFCLDTQLKNEKLYKETSILEQCLSKKINSYTQEHKRILTEEKFVAKNDQSYASTYKINVSNFNAFIAGHQEYFVNECQPYYWYVSAVRAEKLINIRNSYNEKELQLLTKKIQKKKHTKEQLFRRARLYMSQGEYEKAKADFYAYQEEDPNDDNITYHIAWTCELNGEYGVAKSWYKEMIKKNNHFEAILGLELINRKVQERAKIDSVLFFAQYNRLNNIKEVPQKKMTISNKRIERPPSPIGCKHIEDNQELKKCFSSYFKRFVDKHFNLDIMEYTNLKSGIHRIFTKFKVSKEGMITNIFVLNDDPFIVNEITRVLNSVPRLEPGTVNGEPVGVFYSFPIMFSTVE